jgi:hypothetical protein
MSLDLVLLVAAIVSALFGIFFLFGADAAIRSFGLGDSSLPARLLARAVGSNLIAVAVINFLSRGDIGSTALRAVVIGNIVIHVIGLGADFSERYPRNAGIWVSVAIHVAFILAFGYFLLDWPASVAG